MSRTLVVALCLAAGACVAAPSPAPPSPPAATAAAPPVAPTAALSPAQLRAMQTRTYEGFKKESLVTIVTNVFTDRKYQYPFLSGNSLMMMWQEGSTTNDIVYHRLTATFDQIDETTVEVRLMLTRDYFSGYQMVTAEPESPDYHRTFLDAVRVEIERRKAYGRD